MYVFVLTLHSIVRWLVLLAGIAAVVKALAGWLNNAEWSNRDNQLGVLFMIAVDVQLVLGIILYLFLSPITGTVLSDFATAMANETYRYFAVEHAFLMLAALVLVHAGRILPRRTSERNQKHKRAAILLGMALATVVVAIPWFRPLLRIG